MATNGDPSQAGDEEHDERAGALDPNLADPVTVLGVHVVSDPDPAAAAQRMADADDVEIVADRAHAETAFAARVEAGRTAVVVIGERERAELEAAASAPSAHPAVTPEAIAEIRRLADELRRIERIRQRTEDRFTETLSERLAAGSGLALHPDTLRAASRAVLEVESEITRLKGELYDLDGPTSDASAPAASDDEPTPGDRLQSHSRAARFAAVGVALIAVGVAVGAVAAGAPPAVAAGIAVVGLIIAVALWASRRSRRRSRHRSQHRDAIDARLAGLSEPAPVTTRRTPDDDQARMVARARLETGLQRAGERLRSAQRHWESLAGPDADAHDIEAVLRLRDPQYVVGAAAARASPTMRTVNAVHRRALARWRVAWAAVGYHDAPELERTEEVLRALASRPSTDPDGARARLAAAEAWTQAGATIDRVLVLVEPSRWLPAADLASLMGKLPAGAEVIVVQRGA